MEPRQTRSSKSLRDQSGGQAVSSGISPPKKKGKNETLQTKNTKKRSLGSALEDATNIVSGGGLDTDQNTKEAAKVARVNENAEAGHTLVELGKAAVSASKLEANEDIQTSLLLNKRIDAAVKAAVNIAIKNVEKKFKAELDEKIQEIKNLTADKKKSEKSILDLNNTITKNAKAMTTANNKLEKAEKKASDNEARASIAEARLAGMSSSPFSSSSLSPVPGTIAISTVATRGHGRGRGRTRPMTPISNSGNSSETESQLGNSNNNMWAMQSAEGVSQATALMAFTAKKLNDFDVFKSGLPSTNSIAKEHVEKPPQVTKLQEEMQSLKDDMHQQLVNIKFSIL